MVSVPIYNKLNNITTVYILSNIKNPNEHEVELEVIESVSSELGDCDVG